MFRQLLSRKPELSAELASEDWAPVPATQVGTDWGTWLQEDNRAAPPIGKASVRAILEDSDELPSDLLTELEPASPPPAPDAGASDALAALSARVLAERVAAGALAPPVEAPVATPSKPVAAAPTPAPGRETPTAPAPEPRRARRQTLSPDRRPRLRTLPGERRWRDVLVQFAEHLTDEELLILRKQMAG